MLTWQGQELATALERLAQTQRIDIWIDRRIDPSSPVALSSTNRPLHQALASALAPRGWGASPYQGILFIGPQQSTRELLTLSALARRSLNRAPADARAKWLQADAWSIPRLSEPRGLLRELAAMAGAAVRDDHLVSHDLWPARDLPPMAVTDRVVLLLAGFDLTCQISPDGRECRIVRISRPVRVESTYTVSAARAAAVSAVLKELPEAKATRRGSKLSLSATVEEHDQVRASIQGKASANRSPQSSPPSTSPDQQRFTLKIVNQPVGPIIDQIGRQLTLTIDWAAPVESRSSLISCDVREATLDELLTAIFSSTELKFVRDGNAVRITSAQ
jgi:hypothetical protein